MAWDPLIDLLNYLHIENMSEYLKRVMRGWFLSKDEEGVHKETQTMLWQMVQAE